MALVLAYVVLSDLPMVLNVALVGRTKLMNLFGESLGQWSWGSSKRISRTVGRQTAIVCVSNYAGIAKHVVVQLRKGV